MFQVPRPVPGAAYPKPFSLPAGVDAILFSLTFIGALRAWPVNS
jgi:hypothetical protein